MNWIFENKTWLFDGFGALLFLAILNWLIKIIKAPFNSESKKRNLNKNIFNKTITIVNNDTGYQNYWHIGSQSNKPILQIVCNFMVSNIIDQPISLANAILKGIKANQEFVQILVKDVNSKYSGSYAIPPKNQTSVSICFILHPKKFPKNGEQLNLKVGVIDQFGNKYWVNNILFRNA